MEKMLKVELRKKKLIYHLKISSEYYVEEKKEKQDVWDGRNLVQKDIIEDIVGPAITLRYL